MLANRIVTDLMSSVNEILVMNTLNFDINGKAIPFNFLRISDMNLSVYFCAPDCVRLIQFSRGELERSQKAGCRPFIRYER